MQQIIFTDGVTGRKSVVLEDRSGAEPMHIILGPPEGLVEELGLPEPFATRLHNILCDRGLLSYKDVATNQKVLLGALQEALMIDVQRLAEAYYKFEKETV